MFCRTWEKADKVLEALAEYGPARVSTPLNLRTLAVHLTALANNRPLFFANHVIIRGPRHAVSG
jgi:hypothetical protein